MLSPRQAQLLPLLLTDTPMKEIANSMGVDPSTLDMHAKFIYRKLGVSGRLGLILAVYRDKTVPEPLNLKKIIV